MYMLKPGSNNAPDPVTLMDESQLVLLWVYPVDMTLSLKLAQVKSGVGNMPDIIGTQMDAPISNTQNALALWNRYSSDGQESLRAAFLMQARCLVEYEQRIGEDAGGWPLDFPPASPHAGKHYLSALVQGQALSVLARAYILTRDTTYLEVARRAVRTFERDILDGGVSTPIAGNGLFFEQWAVYPAAHTLEGMVFALLGLHDYLALVDGTDISTLIQCAHDSLHRFLPEFETGYWTRANLLNRRLASDAQHEQQLNLLQALSQVMGCEECAAGAARWKGHQQRGITRLLSMVERRCASVVRACWRPLQSLLFHYRTLRETSPTEPLRVCVPIVAFPVSGGMRAVVASIAHVTSEIWRIEYLTQYVGPNPQQLPIHSFGLKISRPWQFPAVWLYVLAGARKLIVLLRRSGKYAVILPQDGIYTAAFSALVARLAGIRVVCMDYGNLTLLNNPSYKKERRQSLANKNCRYRVLGPILFKLYWPSLSLFIRIATRLVDHFLISGVEGDGIEDVYCGRLGVPRSHITRYAYMIDINRHPIFDAPERVRKREQCGIAPDALVITMICRLAPEKGIDLALDSISQALTELPPEQKTRLLFVLAGGGPLREQIEADIKARRLHNNCRILGEVSPEEVVTLLGLSDIFLQTSTRAAYYSVAVLEAMASGCAIVTSNEPPLNTQLLTDERGIVVRAGDTQQTARALVSLLNEPSRGRQMGANARRYIERHHSPTAFKRVLQRAIGWSLLDTILYTKSADENVLEDHEL
jgi:glycosyltransferase involved in cell wall biosynthesis